MMTIPCVTLDGLASIVFCYALPRTPKMSVESDFYPLSVCTGKEDYDI